jgi:Flp pilus assembly protein TadG
MRRLLRSLRDDESGVSVVELSLVAPILATMVVGLIDLSRGYSDKLILQQVAQRLVEKAMQGMQGESSTAIFNTLRAEGALAAGVPVNQVTIRYWLECNGVSQNTNPLTMAADYNKVCPAGQVYSRHLNVRIIKHYEPFFSLRWVGTNANGTFTLRGEAGLRVQ